MTFGELKAELAKLTEEQLAMPVLWAGDERGGKVSEVHVLDEDQVSVGGEGMEPLSLVSEEDRAEIVATWKAGTPMLLVDG